MDGDNWSVWWQWDSEMLHGVQSCDINDYDNDSNDDSSIDS